MAQGLGVLVTLPEDLVLYSQHILGGPQVSGNPAPDGQIPSGLLTWHTDIDVVKICIYIT